LRLKNEPLKIYHTWQFKKMVCVASQTDGQSENWRWCKLTCVNGRTPLAKVHRAGDKNSIQASTVNNQIGVKTLILRRGHSVMLLATDKSGKLHEL
jgi:hypothetical protein